MYKIGIFDSGIGGLTVLKKIKEKMPESHLLYYGDNKNAPYGDKKEEDIKNLCIKIGEFLYSNKVDAIVIACNTATAASLEELQKKFKIPIIGTIEPGIKSALKTTVNGNIAVIATPATVKMNAYKNTFDIHATNTETLIQKSCKLFCPMIENGWKDFYGDYMTDEIVKLYIGEISKKIDTLVLGCTHYPIIKKDISEIFTGNIIDPALETTEELIKKISKLKPKNKRLTGDNLEFVVSSNKEQFLTFAEIFLEEKIKNIRILELNE